MNVHPYMGLPPTRRWSKAMAAQPDDGWDPVAPPPFPIAAQDRIATAGSCFAQHLARHLRDGGREMLLTETAHPLLPPALAESFQYGIYSARYGNIYSSRQLLQLWLRAHGRLCPGEDAWQHEGAWFDPFRPDIQPGGFATREEFERDRLQHFAAVRAMFAQAQVLVFTLGLTEHWYARADGAVYPICPGVIAGRFDPARHAFGNLTVDEMVADLRQLLVEARRLNPALKLILTVSPVPLAATATEDHVALANAVAKASLRLAAATLARDAGVYYFPAYEIITAPGQDYFAADRRSVREEGVNRVMALFFHKVLQQPQLERSRRVDNVKDLPFEQRMSDVVATLCEEQRLDDELAGAGDA